MFIPIWMIILIAVLVITLVFVLIFITFSKINKTYELMKKLGNRLEKMSSNLKLYAEKVSSEPKSVDKSEFNEDSFTTLLFIWFRNINTCMAFFTLMLPAVSFFLSKVCNLDINKSDMIIVFVVIGILLMGILIWKMMVDRKRIIKNRRMEILAISVLVFLAAFIGFSLVNLAAKLIFDSLILM